jgi:N-acetylglutamate synthase-like GNAT family acetyltransferase
MAEPIEIRRATAKDARAISAVVKNTIRISNSKDYPASVIERVLSNFSPDAVRQLMDKRTVWVALKGGVVVGTASLEGDTVKTVFVSPSTQRIGIGNRLMMTVEEVARGQSLKLLRVPASMTARSFYARLGFADVREVFYGEERTFLMEKSLT